MKLVLKIDVDTLRGTREGVPNLVRMLERHRAGATFLFSLGPDHTGRAIRRVFRRGFLSKASRTSVLEHYGLKQLLYGTVLPGPDIGKLCASLMRNVADAGFDVGIHTWDHVRWQNHVQGANAEWTRREMQTAVDRFGEIFRTAPATHGAAGWQMNTHAYRLEAELGFVYCSDTRGQDPFLPVVDGSVIACPQLPTTLPTLDELIGVDSLTPATVAGHLLALSESPPATGHVYTLHAELEGMKLAPAFEQLLTGWAARGFELVSMRTMFDSLDITRLRRCDVGLGTVPGRSGTLAVQARAVAA